MSKFLQRLLANRSDSASHIIVNLPYPLVATSASALANAQVNGALATLASRTLRNRIASYSSVGRLDALATKLTTRLGPTRLIATGSNRNLTGIAGYSDEDFFAKLPPSMLQSDSTEVLRETAEALRERYPRTEIRVNRPCVRVPFEDGGETIEITPAIADGQTRLGYPQFQIPDGNGDWMFSAPESHNAYVQEIDEVHNGGVRQLTILAKLWKYERSVALSSFYVEMTCAAQGYSMQYASLSHDLCHWFEQRAAENLSEIVDPRFPRDSFVIRPCKTALSRLLSLGKIETAAARAREAVAAQSLGSVRNALSLWKEVLGVEV